jgi:hypothetical protein
MRHLKNPANVPRKGWLARQPETGTVIKGLSLRGLVDEVIKYRTANHLPTEPNTRRMTENQICDTMEGDEACSKCRFLEEDDERNPKHLRAWRSHGDQLWNFAIAIKGVIEAKAAGITLHVAKSEAERRAGICAQCKYNLPVANCWGCGELGTKYRELVGSLATCKDSLLQSCDSCGCDNKTQVWFTGDVLRPVSEAQGLTAEQFPEWCWKGELLK